MPARRKAAPPQLKFDQKLVLQQWMKRREKLCHDGFSFEYSATFGQSVKAANDRKMEQNYVRWILFDYSYGFSWWML